MLESTFTKITDLTKRMLIPTFLNRDRWDVIATLEAFTGPVFLAHARDDAAIPFAHAERNAAAAAGPAELVEVDQPHHEVWPDAVYERALGFLLPTEASPTP